MRKILWLLGAVLIGVIPVHAQPVLSIQNTGPGRFEVSWPAASADYELEQSPRLAPTDAWQLSPAVPVQQAGRLVVPIVPGGSVQFFRLRGPDFVSIASLSPFDGESGVAVTRETIVRFTGALNPETVLSTDDFYAVSAGRRILSRIELSLDRRQITLFYLEPLPGGAQVDVFLQTEDLLDERGRPLDPAGLPEDGNILSFTTLGLTPLAKTAVVGTVYAAELTPAGANQPLAGVTITVDGMEQTLRTVTDASGKFKLSPVPPGRFFVHIDGRTVTSDALGIRYPDKSYYPAVGKAWEAAPGREDNLAGGTGTIYLPLIVAGTLQPVSQTTPTTVSFPSTVVATNPAFAGVSITVPPNSLFNDNGTRGGKVGIAPVPPDRLPGPLPPGLEMPIVITVQTDGALNFDQPAPVCFPNVIDPVLGAALPAGSRQSLMSFNHRKGEWEAVGTMTVSADGKLVCSDPGSGILQPGWHGVGPQPVGPPPPPCEGDNSSQAVKFLFSTARGDLVALDAASCRKECQAEKDLRDKGHNADFVRFMTNCLAEHTNTCPSAKSILDLLNLELGLSQQFYQECLLKCTNPPPPMPRPKRPKPKACRPKKAASSSSVRAQSVAALQQGDLAIVSQIEQVLAQIRTIVEPYAGSAELPANVQQQILDLMAAANSMAGGNAAAFLENYLLQVETLAAANGTLDEPDGNAPEYPVLYEAEVLRTSGPFYLRGKTEPYGQYQLFVPRDGILLSVRFYDPQTKSYGMVTPRLRPDAPWRLPAFELLPVNESFTDTDQDGLADAVELVYGTDLRNPDSDGDGISDGAEVDQGLNPLDGLIVQTGIIGTTKTIGPAVDVAAGNGLIVTAEGSAGVSIFSPSSGYSPVMLAHLDTAGNAQRVALDGNFLAVADGGAGLAVIDIAEPSQPRLSFTKGLGNAQAVAVDSGVAYVGFASGMIAAVDMLHGTVGATLYVNGAIQDLAVGGDTLYALTGDRLYSLSIGSGFFAMGLLTNVASPFVTSPNVRLSVAGDTAYAVHGKGYNTFDISDPAKPVLIKASNTQQFGWRHIVANGSGIGVAAVSVNLSDDGPHDISLYDVSSRTNTDVFITTFPTPGHATAVTIFNALAYVADREGGLQVINYLPYDSKKTGPGITLRTSFGAAGLEEGQRGRVTAAVVDDVQVRNVTFFIDGAAQAIDGAYPFEFAFNAPTRTSGKTTFRLRAVATDTGGNSTSSPEITVPLLPDRTPPFVVRTDPEAGAALPDDTVRALTVYLSESLDPSTVNGSSVRLTFSGPDEVLGTADDFPVAGAVSYHGELRAVTVASSENFRPGHYRLTLADVRDIAGNSLAPAFTADFSVAKNFLMTYGRTDGTNGTIWLATTDGNYDRQITQGFQPRVSPDGQSLAFRRAASPGEVNTANIYLRDMASGVERLLHNYGGGILNSFDWRAGGGALVYDEGGSIVQLDVIGSRGQQNFLVGADGWDDGPAANPVTDGIAFWNQRSGNPDAGIHVADATGGGRVLVPGTTVNDGWPAWSADGEWVSFWRGGSTKAYYKVRSNGADLTRLTGAFDSTEASPAIWAPNGRILYAPLKTNGVQQLYAFSSAGAGNPVRVPVHEGDDVRWVGSVQLSRFAVAATSPERDQIYPLGLLKRLTVRFTHPVNPATITAQTFRLSFAGPDGAFGTGDDQSISGTTQLNDLGDTADFVPSADLAEGKYHVEMAGSVRDVAGTTLGSPYAWNIEVKKFGFALAYGRTGTNEGTIWITTLDGAYDKQITVGERPRLSPNGRYLLFMRGGGNANFARGNLYIRDLVTGVETLKYNVGGDYLVGFDWRNGTNNIVFDFSCAIYEFRPDNTAPVLIGGDCYDDAPAVNPLDGTVAFHHSGGIRLADANGANKRSVPNTAAGDYWPQWSPDGSWISFYRTSSMNLFKVRPDGTGLTQLTFTAGTKNDSFPSAPAQWSLDGSTLFAVGTIDGLQGIYAIPATGGGKPSAFKTSTESNFDMVGSIIIAPPGFPPAGSQ